MCTINENNATSEGHCSSMWSHLKHTFGIHCSIDTCSSIHTCIEMSITQKNLFGDDGTLVTNKQQQQASTKNEAHTYMYDKLFPNAIERLSL